MLWYGIIQRRTIELISEHSGHKQRRIRLRQTMPGIQPGKMIFLNNANMLQSGLIRVDIIFI